MSRLAAVGIAAIVAVAAGTFADRVLSGPSSWSTDPFPVEGWLVELAGPASCTPQAGQTQCIPTKADMLDVAPCVQRFEHDHPDWTAKGCGTRRSFVDGIQRSVDVTLDDEVYEEDHGDGILIPNPWFAPDFDEWPSPTTTTGELTLYPLELVYGGADVIGLDPDGVPILYVQRNQSMLEKVSVFVRDERGAEFPTEKEVAAALKLSGLPDAEFAAALVSDDRLAAARRQFGVPE